MTQDVFVTRIATFLPHAPVNNEQMEQVLGMAGDRPSRSRRIVLRNNGITARHYVLDPDTGAVRYNNAELAAEAVRALTDEQFTLAHIDCLAVGTSIPDQLLPNHGVMVHGELGNPPCEVITTSGICLAGTTALKYAWLAIKSGEHRHAVASGSEAASLVLRGQRYDAETQAQADALEKSPELAFEKDFLRWMLSDAAGAMLLQDRPNTSGRSLRLDWLDVFSYANELPVCMYAGGDKTADGSLRGWAQYSHDEIGAQSIMAVKQDVKLLNANVVHYCLERGLSQVIDKRRLQHADIDWFLPHMSSEYFRQPLAEGLARIGFPIAAEKWFTNLSQRGNTGSASIYLMLDELFNSDRLQPGQRILCFVPESGRFSTAFIHFTVV